MWIMMRIYLYESIMCWFYESIMCWFRCGEITNVSCYFVGFFQIRHLALPLQLDNIPLPFTRGSMDDIELVRIEIFCSIARVYLLCVDEMSGRCLWNKSPLQTQRNCNIVLHRKKFSSRLFIDLKKFFRNLFFITCYTWVLIKVDM